MNPTLKTLASLCVLVLFSAVAESQIQAPDTILIDARVLSVDEADNEFSALAITGEQISALGTTAEIRSLADDRTQVIDLEGRTVVPGLIDSHIHAIRHDRCRRPDGRRFFSRRP